MDPQRQEAPYGLVDNPGADCTRRAYLRYRAGTRGLSVGTISMICRGRLVTPGHGILPPLFAGNRAAGGATATARHTSILALQGGGVADDIVAACGRRSAARRMCALLSVTLLEIEIRLWSGAGDETVARRCKTFAAENAIDVRLYAIGRSCYAGGYRDDDGRLHRTGHGRFAAAAKGLLMW